MWKSILSLVSSAMGGDGHHDFDADYSHSDMDYYQDFDVDHQQDHTLNDDTHHHYQDQHDLQRSGLSPYDLDNYDKVSFTDSSGHEHQGKIMFNHSDHTYNIQGTDGHSYTNVPFSRIIKKV